jgi:hypothetical protein
MISVVPKILSTSGLDNDDDDDDDDDDNDDDDDVNKIVIQL